MASEYYSDKELALFLEEMIQETKKWLIIVSPFVRISGRIKSYLETLIKRRVKIILVYKTNDENTKSQNIVPDDYEWLINNNIQVNSCRNLHAKCYINEKYALVTSMNLHSSSLVNNFEMGVIFKACDNYEMYEYILKDVLNINCDGVSIKFDYEKYNNRGFCIRTGVEIPFNIDKPMCDEAWNEWCEIGDPNIPENYCHYSGEKSNGETSVRYPIKYEYFREASEEYNIGSFRDKSMWWGKGKKSL